MRICVTNWPVLVLYVIQFYISHALYEDQVGKFDWRLENVGEVRHAAFDISQKSKQILVASRENVLSSLSMTTGKIGWRHVLEDSTVLHDMIDISSNILTVSAKHLRKWNPQGGYLVWDVALLEPVVKGSYVISGDVIILAGSNKITAFSLKTGIESYSLDAPWTGEGEVLVGSAEDSVYISVISNNKLTIYLMRDEIVKEKATMNLPSTYACSGGSGVWLICYNAERKQVEYMDMSRTEKVAKFISLPSQPEYVAKPTMQVVGEKGLLVQDFERSGMFYVLSTSQATQVIRFEGVGVVTKDAQSDDVLMTVQSETSSEDKASLRVRMYSIEDGSELDSYGSTVSTTITARPVKIVPYIYSKTGGSQAYRVLVIFSDHSLALLQQAGKVLWAREEALASISCLEMVDLPVSDVEAQMEEEFGSHATNNVLSQFIGRLFTQVQQLTSFVIHQYHKQVTGLRVVMETSDHMTMDEDYLTRDEFGIHKMIIAVTNVGKIYGLDSYTGKVIWSHYASELEPFKTGNRLLLYIQRTTAHFPHEPYATVIGHRSCEGCGSVVFSFNPITGTAYTPRPVEVSYKIDQAMMLPHMQHDFLKPIVLLDTLKQVHVYPEDSVVEGAQEMFVFSAQPTSGNIVGLRLSGDTLQTLEAQPTWSVSLGSTILALKTKQYREHVHSLGRVLADRSVFYKYVNPNLVAIITESEPNTEHASLSIYLLDGVTGRIVFTSEHKKSTGPVHMVHSENWIVYTYYNVKARRSEIAVLELYEGNTQSNATAFSSLETNTSPIVMRQAYILGTTLTALSTTLTEKGITGKNILMARSVGGIVEVPKMFIDPRRPREPSQSSKEEGVPPYMPELPLSFDNTINYNQSVFRIRDIHSEPSGLESTSLVVAYGLDVFHTRVAPSKMYDVLKDDFDYLFIGGVTLGMILISFVTRHFALRKLVTRAWK